MASDLQRLAGRERAGFKAEANKLEKFKSPRTRSGKLRVAEAIKSQKEELKHQENAKRAFGQKPI
jgi:hypothetical protein